MRTRKLNAGVSLLEAVIAVTLATGLLYVLWSSHSSARRSEISSAINAAARGALLFERHLREDMACLDLSRGREVCTTAANLISLSLARAETGTLTKRFERLYELKTISNDSTRAFEVLRDGRKLKGVIVKDFKPQVVTSNGKRFLQIELTTLDPGLLRNGKGELCKHAVTLLVALPWTPSGSSFVDYTVSPPR